MARAACNTVARVQLGTVAKGRQLDADHIGVHMRAVAGCGVVGDVDLSCGSVFETVPCDEFMSFFIVYDCSLN